MFEIQLMIQRVWRTLRYLYWFFFFLCDRGKKLQEGVQTSPDSTCTCGLHTFIYGFPPAGNALPSFTCLFFASHPPLSLVVLLAAHRVIVRIQWMNWCKILGQNLEHNTPRWLVIIIVWPQCPLHTSTRIHGLVVIWLSITPTWQWAHGQQESFIKRFRILRTRDGD